MAARAKKKKNKRNTFERLLLGQLPDFKIILQKCFLGDPLPKFLKWFCSAKKKKKKKKKKMATIYIYIKLKKNKQTTTTTKKKQQQLINGISF